MNLFKNTQKNEGVRDAINASITRIRAFGIKLKKLNKSIDRIGEVSSNISHGMGTMDDLREASDISGERVREANEVLAQLRQDLEHLYEVLDE